MTPALRNPLLVAWREYVARVRTRAFVILTIFVAVAAVAVVLLPVALRAYVTAGGETESRIEVVWEGEDFAGDPVGALITHLNTVAGTGVANGGPGVGSGAEFHVTAAADAGQARESLEEGHLDGVLTLDRGENGDLTFSYYTRASGSGRQATLIRQAASVLAVQDRMDRLGIGEADQLALFAAVDFSVSVAGGQERTEDGRSPEELAGRLAAVTALVVLVFAAIITYGQWIATSVAEEKSSRVMELLICAASSRELLAGKVLGAGAAGLTQYVAVVVPASATIALQDRIAAALTGETPPASDYAALDMPLLLAFGGFFLLAFSFYALLYAAAGSLATRSEEVQQVAMPMMLLLTAGYVVSFVAFEDTDAQWVRVMSYIPFFSPTLMLARLGLGHVEPWEVGLAVGLLLLAIALAFLLAARVYRAGILLYGQRRGFRTIFRATRVSR